MKKKFVITPSDFAVEAEDEDEAYRIAWDVFQDQNIDLEVTPWDPNEGSRQRPDEHLRLA